MTLTLKNSGRVRRGNSPVWQIMQGNKKVGYLFRTKRGMDKFYWELRDANGNRIGNHNRLKAAALSEFVKLQVA